MRMIRDTAAVLILGANLLLLAACDSGKPTGHASPTATSAPAKSPDMNTVAAILEKQGSASSPAGLPAGHPPMGGAAPQPKTDGGLPAGHPPMTGGTPAAPSMAKVSATLKYDVPTGWKETAPTSQMRKAQFTLPRADGDPEDGQMIVFYFGPGQGGTIESNIDRWKGMFKGADGNPVPDDKMKLGTTQADGMKVTTLDVAGRYADQMGRPDKPGATEQDFRMLAAIVEAPDGPWFFKAVGPMKTMTAHDASFQKLVKSIRK
ncbi:MAG: hypothetical protein AABZ08_04110 [Planctomycetota bacterium]